MAYFSSNTPPDVVTVMWQNNPLRNTSPGIIVDVNIIGSADPCSNVLRRGRRFRVAEDCLLENGFLVEYEERFGVFGVTLFIRKN